MKISSGNLKSEWKPLLVASAFTFLYATVVAKLVGDWWSDDNYSHGLIVPYVIAYIIWESYRDLLHNRRNPEVRLGSAVVLISLGVLLGGTLGAELFTQRVSLVGMIAGIVIYFFGSRILRGLIVPFILLLLSIPIPQIIFNKITFPMQLLASRISEWAIGLFNIASVRRGNVIEILPLGGAPVVALEVVQACSGIRSLMALVTIALILGYFTREHRKKVGDGSLHFWGNVDFWRTIILMISAIPIALLTNAARVALTAIATYYFGKQASEGFWHESAGAIVFLCGLGLLFGFNILLRRILPVRPEVVSHGEIKNEEISHGGHITTPQTVALFILLLAGGVFINWFVHRGEVQLERKPFKELPAVIGQWNSAGSDQRFDVETEKVLKADDYLLRTYFANSIWINFYAGYYGSQRSGSTYHSPLNCLPGSGWEIKDSGYITVSTVSGRSFVANRYVVEHRNERYLMIYWYQGRGRVTANEYKDKLYTTIDSLTQRRSDGSLVRFMTRMGSDENKSETALFDFISKMSDELSMSIPD
ncbi:MAG: exosortase C-terminal domain/associated protein EpsI [Acidobacteriota bacterium]